MELLLLQDSQLSSYTLWPGGSSKSNSSSRSSSHALYVAGSLLQQAGSRGCPVGGVETRTDGKEGYTPHMMPGQLYRTSAFRRVYVSSCNWLLCMRGQHELEIGIVPVRANALHLGACCISKVDFATV